MVKTKGLIQVDRGKPRAALALLAVLLLQACHSGQSLQLSSNLDPTALRVGPGTIQIRWRRPAEKGSVRIYMGTDPDAVDGSRLVAKLEGGRAELSELEPDTRFFFKLVPEDGTPSRIIGERLIPLEGTRNFRDLGGYETQDGRFIRWAQLYRSDHLANLTPGDLQRLADLKLRLICDLRSHEEVERYPDRLPRRAPPLLINPAVEFGPLAPSRVDQVISSGNAEGINFASVMMQANKFFARGALAQMRTLIRHLESEDNIPFLLHCSAGKDRTGFAAAVILLILGVPENTVMEDYLLTNVYTARHIGRTLAFIRLVSLFRIAPDDARPLLSVRREFLQTAFDTIDEDYGSFDSYVQRGLGISDSARERLRQRFLR